MHYFLVVLDAEGPAQACCARIRVSAGQGWLLPDTLGSVGLLAFSSFRECRWPWPVAVSLQPVLRLKLCDLLPPPCQDPSDDSGPPRYSRIAAPSQGPSLTPICKAPLSCPVTCSPIFGRQWAAFGGSSGWPPTPAPPSGQVKELRLGVSWGQLFPVVVWGHLPRTPPPPPCGTELAKVGSLRARRWPRLQSGLFVLEQTHQHPPAAAAWHPIVTVCKSLHAPGVGMVSLFGILASCSPSMGCILSSS